MSGRNKVTRISSLDKCIVFYEKIRMEVKCYNMFIWSSYDVPIASYT